MSRSVMRGLDGVLGLASFLYIQFFLAIPFPALLPMFVIILLCCGIGFVAGHALAHESDVDGRGFQMIALGNLVAWIVPVAGITLSMICSVFARKADERAIYFYALSTIGSLASFANMIVGANIGFERQQQEQTIRASGYNPNLPHTRDRCPMAAREGWPEADIIAACR